MLGAILGDIVGSPFEFDHNNYKHKDFPLLSEKSHFTDDTVMTAAVAVGLIDGKGLPERTFCAVQHEMRFWGREYPHAGSAGGCTQKIRIPMKGVLHRPEKSDILNPESISNFLGKGENGMEHLYEKALESAEYIKTHTKKRPKIAVVLGSGLGKLTADFTDTEELSYKDIPNFPVSTVAGHKGALLAGKLGDTEVYAMEGRFHFYEGYSMKEVCYPFYVFKLLGVEKVVLTNACGGINREFAPGTLMLITDFINMMGTNPLIGPNDEHFGPRFPDMTEPYSLELRNLAKQTADELGIAYKEGVYMGFMGPCYETAAEIRAFAGMGADAVGMSTVPETMVCNYMGMKVLAVSCITNMATGIQTVKHSHARVLEIANQAGDTLCRWLGAVIQRME